MTNLLDLPLDQFRGYLAEGNYPQARQDELMRAYRAQNSLSGLLDRYGEEGLEGKNVSTFFPVAGPGGMSIFDALKSGQLQTRFKDYASDALGGVLGALENPKASYDGTLPQADYDGAAMGTAGLAMGGGGVVAGRNIGATNANASKSAGLLAAGQDFSTPKSPSMAQVMHEEMYESSPKMRARRARQLGLDISQKQISELLKKRGKRAGQDFGYVDPLIEARNTRKSRTPTEIEKFQARKAEIEVSTKAMQQKFAAERAAEVQRYEREEAARKATRDNLLAAARQARKFGYKVRSSSGRDGKISSYYVETPDGDVRLSDHQIPANARREFMAREHGRGDYTGYHGRELIIDENTKIFDIEQILKPPITNANASAPVGLLAAQPSTEDELRQYLMQQRGLLQ